MMAEDRAGSAGESPSHSPDPGLNGEPSPHHSPIYHQNGVTYQNGGSEGSQGEDESMDSHYDTPLDFSIKKREAGSDVEESRYDMITPPPRDDPRENGYYKAGQAVFPHMNGLPSPKNVQKSENCISPRQCKTEPEKIGEPQTALPGMMPGMTLPTSVAAAAAAQAGLLPGFLSGMGPLPNQASLLSALPFLQMDPRAAAAAAALAAGQIPSQGTELSPNATKNDASFSLKNYSKEALASLPIGYSIPGGPPPLQKIDLATMSTGNEDLAKHYNHLLQQQSPEEPNPRNGEHVRSKHRTISGGSSPTYTPSSSEQGSPNARSTPTLMPAPPGAPLSPGSMPYKCKMPSAGRKRPKTIPENLKDAAYWERRRKNNEAAKRSRDARRAKEDEIAIRAAFLEQENLKLRVEVAALKNETSKLRCMLYNSS